jgi:hypothetical protein
MTHERVKNLLTDLAAGELGGLASWRVRRHLAQCSECAREWEQVQALWSHLQATATAEAPSAPVWAAREIVDALPPTNNDEETKREERIPMRRRFVLPVLAAGAVLVTAILPQSGWLVRNQLKVAFGAGIEHLSSLMMPSPEKAAAELDAVAKRYPDDFSLQLGLAIRQQDETKRRAALLTLAPQFGEEAALWGALLNSDYTTTFHTPASPADKGEPWKLSPDIAESAPLSPALREFLNAARSGEKADPENAFFPMMEAYGLIAARRPHAAMDAVCRAGTKPHFTDYWSVEVEAGWRLQTALHGEVGALGRMAQMSGIIPGASVQMRSVARAVFGHALALEQEGKTKEALELRAALLRVAVRMQNDPTTSYLSNLYGSAIASVAQNRPGGAPKIEKSDTRLQRIPLSERDNGLMRLRADVFAEYAAQHGYPELGTLAKANVEAFKRRNEAQERVHARYIIGIPGLEYSGALLGASLLLLFGVLWTIFFGGIAFALGRTARIRRGEPLHPAIRLGFWLTLSLCVFGIGLSIQAPYAQIIMPLGALGLMAAQFLRLNRVRGDERLSRGVGLMVSTAAATLATIFVARMMVMGPLAFARNLVQQFGMKSEVSSAEKPFGQEGFIIGLICLSFPLLMVWGLAIWSRKKRLPASVGIVRGFRRFAVPMASILLLLYAGSAFWAAQADAQLRAELTESTRQGGRYIARLAGMGWPLLKE